ncbi:MAG: hypothetical protein IT166_18385 [Bryobacterales bacterium]|nr:hypothetical protein [Bryobacterales bacterium]
MTPKTVPQYRVMPEARPWNSPVLYLSTHHPAIPFHAFIAVSRLTIMPGTIGGRASTGCANKVF